MARQAFASSTGAPIWRDGAAETFDLPGSVVCKRALMVRVSLAKGSLEAALAGWEEN